ncbi:hypothetical protein [Haladaptatus cibarius]|uniref:hypothetical protein n=1 Tax=Haladaptatus cibarius TaxID=453847 RepID=UPI0011848AF5|nr:hypothetical protein [Haladaptatus cibarius]
MASPLVPFSLARIHQAAGPGAPARPANPSSACRFPGNSPSDKREQANQSLGGAEGSRSRPRLLFLVSQNRRAILMAGKSLPLPVATGERRVSDCKERMMSEGVT